ncbi:MAG: hypothetical protein GVY30_02580 [Chloroflexi bacterium]|jgi:hypothetical protein|nr:hypothetical protein [Chloroflexota bacterium]
MKQRWLLFITAVLLVVSLACSLGGSGTEAPATEAEVTEEVAATEEVEETEETVEATEETEATAAPTEEEEEMGGSDSEEDEGNGKESSSEDLEIDPGAMNELSSYRSRITMEVELAGDEGESQLVEVEMSVTQEPVAQHIVMVSQGEEIEMIQIGNDQWMRFGEDWMQSTVEETETDMTEQLSSFFMDVEDFGALEDEEYEYMGQEKVNGLNTRHYSLEYSSLLGGLGLGEEEEIEKGEADVWIVDEPDLPQFVLRADVYMEGAIDGEEGKIMISQEIYDVNADFTIEPPADAASGGLPEDIPMYENATNVNAMAGMTFFSTPDDVATVADFYVEAMPENGWTRDEAQDMVVEGTAMYTFEKEEGRTAQITITEADEEGSDVIITVEEPAAEE